MYYQPLSYHNPLSMVDLYNTVDKFELHPIHRLVITERRTALDAIAIGSASSTIIVMLLLIVEYYRGAIVTWAVLCVDVQLMENEGIELYN